MNGSCVPTFDFSLPLFLLFKANARGLSLLSRSSSVTFCTLHQPNLLVFAVNNCSKFQVFLSCERALAMGLVNRVHSQPSCLKTFYGTRRGQLGTTKMSLKSRIKLTFYRYDVIKPFDRTQKGPPEILEKAQGLDRTKPKATQPTRWGSTNPKEFQSQRMYGTQSTVDT